MDKVVILPNGQAMSERWGVFNINGLMVMCENGYRFYHPEERFFKLSCPPFTSHQFHLLDTGKINIY